MGESCIERMERIDAKTKIANFMVKEKQPYEFKVKYARIRAEEFVRECDKRGLNYHVSVGGLDSITLFCFLKSIGINAPGISVSYLEDTSIQKVHKELGIERLKSAIRYVDENGTEHRWSKPAIIQEFGFPVLSKEIAGKIETLAHPTEKNKTVRHAIVTGETGAIGSRDDFTTFFRDKDNEITVKCGCFLGKIDKFLEKVTQTHGDSKYALVYRAAVEVARLQIDLSGEAPKDADE